VTQALSPAKELQVEIDEKEKTAKVFVAPEELSLAIGRDGQNVRLASKLTGYRIEIEGKDELSKLPPEEVQKEKIEPAEKIQEEKIEPVVAEEAAPVVEEVKSEESGASHLPISDDAQPVEAKTETAEPASLNDSAAPIVEEKQKVSVEPTIDSSENSQTPASSQEEPAKEEVKTEKTDKTS
jgi:N utilization substance protein A